MARAQASDPLHGFRFHARAGAVAGLASSDVLQPGGVSTPGVGDTAEAGFTSITSPEYTLEMAEYREGTKTYTEKYPGIPTVNELTFSRGVARNDTGFIGWIMAAIEGREYRTDITIFHGTRESRSAPFNLTNDFSPSNSKQYRAINATPVRVKFSGDLDASTSDVSISEMDVAVEQFTLITASGVQIGP